MKVMANEDWQTFSKKIDEIRMIPLSDIIENVCVITGCLHGYVELAGYSTFRHHGYSLKYIDSSKGRQHLLGEIQDKVSFYKFIEETFNMHPTKAYKSQGEKNLVNLYAAIFAAEESCRFLHLNFPETELPPEEILPLCLYLSDSIDRPSSGGGIPGAIITTYNLEIMNYFGAKKLLYCPDERKNVRKPVNVGEFLKTQIEGVSIRDVVFGNLIS